MFRVYNRDKYINLSGQCESNMEFYDNITKQNYYELYNSMFVVLLVEKSDYSPENNQNLVVTAQNFASFRTQRTTNFINHVVGEAHSYCVLCSFNDSIFDIYDVCVDKQRRSMGHATNLTKGCVKFVDYLIKNVIAHTSYLFAEKFGRYALRSTR